MMSDAQWAVVGLVILAVIAVVGWVLARQARRRSEDGYVGTVPGSEGGKIGSRAHVGTSAMDQTLMQQGLTSRTTWNVAGQVGKGENGGDGSA